MPSKIRILFLGANPSDTTRLALGREVREITQRLRATHEGERFEIVQEWAVRVSDLQAALLRHRPQIVHFSGHGRGALGDRSPDSVRVGREMLPADEPRAEDLDGEILVEDDAGRAKPIPASALANLFGIMGGVRCVVLNACHSAAQAEAIQQHVDAVIGMSRKIEDAAAINFAWAFYQGLGFGESLSNAFELGKNQIELAGFGDGEVPRLLTREVPSRAGVVVADARPRASRDVEEERVDPFLASVERVARLRHAGARITRHEGPAPWAGTLDIEVQEGAIFELRVVGAVDRPITEELLTQYIKEVVQPLRQRDPYGGKPTLVHAGASAAYAFQMEAARRGVLLKSFSEYQGLLDFTRYLERQTERLESDGIYPPWLYVDQPARVSLAGAREERRVESALATLWQELDTPLHPRFALVLGDFGAGKTFLLHELARRMATEKHPLVPVLVEMSKLEKAQTLKTLLAQHFAAADMAGFDFDAFQYMLAEGRIALLFDGFDELALRLPYDRAVQHFETVLQAAHGLAKVVVTSRRQHFLTDHDVKRALAEQAERTQGYRFFLLDRFEEPQIRRFLQNTLRDPVEADARYRQLDNVKDLLGLSHNPRMLGFIAKIDKQKLRRAEENDEEVTAAKLYEWLVDQWLDFEYERANPPGAPRGVSRKALRTVMSDLALLLWDRPVKTVEIQEIRECVVSRMRALGEPVLDAGILEHLFGSGSLFVRDRDGVFQFVHRSVLEWLVAEVAARDVVRKGDSSALALDEMSELMADFFASMVGKDAALDWASGKLSGAAEGHAKKNAALLLKRIEKTWGPLPEVDVPVTLDLVGQDLRGGDYSGVDWSEANLAGADLQGATLVGAKLWGASLAYADLSRADLRGADLSRVDLTAADLSFVRAVGADLTMAGPIEPARWRGANLLRAKGIQNEWLEPLIAEGAVPPSLRQVEPMWLSASRCSSVAFCADGNMLAAGHVDGTVWLVDARRGKVLRVLLGHTGEARSVAFSADCKRIASGSSDTTIRVWDVATGRISSILEGHVGAVNSVVFAADDEVLVSGSEDKSIRLWDVDAGRQMGVFQWLRGAVTSLALSPDGKTLASGSSDKLIGLWDFVTIGSSTMIAALRGHTDVVRSVAFAPDGKTLASGSADKTIRLWDVETRRTVSILHGHAKAVTSVAFAPDGKNLASGSSDHTARLWNSHTGRETGRIVDHENSVMSVAFAPDGTRFAVGSWDTTLRLWDVRTGRPIHVFERRPHSVTSVAFAPDGKTLASGSDDRTVRLWDLETGRRLRTLEGHLLSVTSVAFAPDGRTLASVSGDNLIRLWDVKTEGVFRALVGHGNVVTSVAFSPDGMTLATGSHDDSVRLWDVATGREIRTFQSHEGPVTSVAFAPDGRTLASSSSDLTILLWDLLRRQTIRIFAGHKDVVTSVAFAPDGKALVSASQDKTVRLWDVSAGLEARILEGHTDFVTSVAFTPDGQTIASGSADNTLRLWDVGTGRAIGILKRHASPVTSVAFSPDGRTLASASADGTIHLWDPSTARCIAILLTTPEGWVAFTPDGRYKLGGDIGGSFWHVAGLCRFEPGEIDPYLDLRLRDRTSILPAKP
ncbi:pentapeptide repeat-containing protein [Polyangium jinanense]|uniref:Pentapeptide repeat-containing protein n=1 Tax=Polyangium jinanense TaxID=2829994 RepID=A0A9X4AQV4_9BACT|nr:pentapeptide repeat-containing protein [Polyangium jinanense]MDC3981473.1 pentapeptide repeat-containing protein [Polyangium jinanense]